MDWRVMTFQLQPLMRSASDILALKVVDYRPIFNRHNQWRKQ